MSCFLGCLACLFCDFLCCECNCLIFPHPECSYEEEASLDELDISMRINFHKNQERDMPYVEMSTPKSRGSKKCIVYFHGNAQDIGLVVTFLQPIVLATNITFFAVEYPTYGLYPKAFSARISNTIKEDALAFYDHLLKDRTQDDIAVMGRSIGTGGASYLAGNKNVPALILVSPFDTIKKVSMGMVGCLGGIVKQHFNNEQQLKKFNGRLLVIHGENDEVIRIGHGKNLVDVYESQNPYKNTTVTNYPTRMTHNKFDLSQDIVKPIIHFLKEIDFKSG